MSCPRVRGLHYSTQNLTHILSDECIQLLPRSIRHGEISDRVTGNYSKLRKQVELNALATSDLEFVATVATGGRVKFLSVV